MGYRRLRHNLPKGRCAATKPTSTILSSTAKRQPKQDGENQTKRKKDTHDQFKDSFGRIPFAAMRASARFGAYFFVAFLACFQCHLTPPIAFAYRRKQDASPFRYFFHT